jgi:hypothetical protein
MWYAWTEEAYRRQRAAYRLFGAALDDLARMGVRHAFGVCSRTNVAQIKNAFRFRGKLLARTWTTRSRKLVYASRFARRTLGRHVFPSAL